MEGGLLVGFGMFSSDFETWMWLTLMIIVVLRGGFDYATSSFVAIDS